MPYRGSFSKQELLQRRLRVIESRLASCKSTYGRKPLEQEIRQITREIEQFEKSRGMA